MNKDRISYRQMQQEIEKKLEEKLQETKYNETKDSEYRTAVRHLSRVPGNCPVSKCREIIFPSNLMMHMLHKHVNAIGSTNSEIYEHKPLIMCFDPNHFTEFGVNNCFATLMYGGKKGKIRTRPGLTYLCNPNSALINDHHRFDHFLPIMLIVCRTTWYAQLKDKLLEAQLVSINARKAGIYVFWLVAPKTTRKLYYTLTIYDRYYLNSRSVIRVVRDYTQSQNPSEFLPNEDNYLLLRDSEVKSFMSMSHGEATPQLRPGIPIELIIYENPNNPPIRHSSQRELHAALKQAQDVYIMDSVPRLRGSTSRVTPPKAKKPRGKKSRNKQNDSASECPISLKSIFKL
ncbi:uncharacterized protein LOC6583012 [Drosophila mojavensis]|uniref:DUF4729 domain-containing protein n=1 Tax=Drosophila mojavensis TaxID=7230 RepID=B4L0J8_DROMO|nr:uncharacterized protein LOC6583012 [Drosophila mojavensis]EDW19167.1 uncharacterized protein Dmoj_GI11677 [Drosophila mojavensis]